MTFPLSQISPGTLIKFYINGVTYPPNTMQYAFTNVAIFDSLN